MTQEQTPIPCYLETAPGLAEVAWLEIRRRFPQAKFGEFLFAKDENGIVLFTHQGDPADLFVLRMSEALFLNASYMEDVARGYRDLRRLRERLIQSGDLGRAVNAFTRHRRSQPTSYQVIVRKYGQHEYGRRDVRETILGAVETLYPEWQGKQDNADMEIWANVIGSNLLVGVRLPEQAGHRQRPAAVAGVRPSIAAAAILLTEPEAADRFLDPRCVGGALLAERVDAGPVSLALGGDAAPVAVTTARRQAGPTAAVYRWQPDALPLAAASVNKIATLFPAAPGGAYARWLGEVQRVLQPGGRAVILTPGFEAFKDAIRAHPSLTILGGYSTTIRERWGRIYIVRRD